MNQHSHSKEAAQIEKYIKSKMENIENQNFDHQLRDEIQKRIVRQQKIIASNLKREIALEKSLTSFQNKQQQIKRDLQSKLEKSDEQRMKRNKQKMDSMHKERKYREQLLQERMNLIKEQEIQDRREKLKKYNEKMGKSAEIKPKNVSYHYEEEPHYQKMKKSLHSEYEEMRKKVENKKVFVKGEFKRHQRRYSSGDLHEIGNKYEEIEREKINKVGQHLVKIEASRKKKQNLVLERIKKSKSLQKYAMEQQKQRLREIQLQQKNRSQLLLKKLMMETPSKQYSSITLRKKVSNPGLTFSNPQQTQSNAEERKSNNYRKEIQKHIQQYFEKQRFTPVKTSHLGK